MSPAASALALMALLALATLGEGGASAEGLLTVHGGIVALLVVSLLERRGDGSPRGLPATGPAAAFGGFALLAAAGACLAPYRFAAGLVMLEIAGFAAVAWMSARCHDAMSRTLPVAVPFIAAVHGLIAVAQRLQGADRPATTFLNTNHLAAWLVAAMILGVGGFEATPSRRGVIARISLTLAALAGLVLTGSRGALVGLVAGGSVLLAMRWRTGVRRYRRAILVVAAMAGTALLTGVALRFRTDDPYRFHRVQIWSASLEAVAAAPLWGTGPGQFAAAAANLNFAVQGEPLRFGRSFRTTHSDWLRLPCEFGVPAAMLALLGIALCGREMARRKPSTDLRLASVGGALAALAAQASVDNLSERPALVLLAAALAGVAIARPRRSRGSPSAFRASAAAILLLAFAALDVAPYLAWKAVLALPRGHLDDGQRARLDRALGWNPLHPDLWLRRAEDGAASRQWDARGYAEARAAAERAIALSPADARYRLGAARVEALACLRLFRDEATRRRAAARYLEAEALSRHDAVVPLEAGEFLLAAGDEPGARRAAERALALEPESVRPRLLLAAIVEASRVENSAARAARLRNDAKERADRWAARAGESPYARALLSWPGPS